MKATGVVLALLISMTLGCGSPQDKTKVSLADQTFNGKHLLRKMSERLDIDSRLTASFFLVVGEVSQNTTTSYNLKFAWQMNDGIYAISSLPMERMRVRLDETASTPTIEFHWGEYAYLFREDPSYLMNNMGKYIDYAIVTCREKDWPTQIDLPLNRPK